MFVFVFIFLSLFLWCLSSSFALDEQITDKYPVEEPSSPQEERTREPGYQPDRRVNITGFAGILQGYDNNVDLDSERHNDGFNQGIANVDVTYEQTKDLKLKAGVDVFELIYYKYNIDNLSDISPYTGVDLELTPGLVSRNRFAFDYFSYPNRKESTFAGITLSSYLRHFILEDIYHELGYEYLYRWYPDRKITLGSLETGDDDRVDGRHKTKYNIGVYSTRLFVKLSNEISWNDSNNGYQNYYDYWLYRVKPSVMFFFTDRFYTDVSFVYKYTHYNDRRSTENSTRVVRDHTYMANTSFYYDISRNVTFGLTYSYSENQSNDPFQKYSGSILSGGIYYSF